MFVGALLAVRALRMGEIGDGARHESSPGVRELFGYAGFTWLNNISQIFTAQIDRLVLGIFTSGAILGQYGLAWMLALQVSFPGQIANTALGPSIAALLARNHRRRLSRHLSVVSSFATWGAFGALGALLTCAPLIVRVVGSDYSGLPSMFAALGLAQVINVNSGGLGTALNMGGFHRLELLHNGATSLFSATVCFALIPSYGVWGAVTAVFGGALLLLGLRMYRAHVSLDIRPLGRGNLMLAVVGILQVATVLALNKYYGESVWTWCASAAVVLGCAILGGMYCDGAMRRLLMRRIRRQLRRAGI